MEECCHLSVRLLLAWNRKWNWRIMVENQFKAFWEYNPPPQGGGTSLNFQWGGQEQDGEMDPNGSKVFKKWGVTKI